MYFLKKYRRGILNKYRRGIPLSEAVHKDILLASKQVKHYFQNGRRQRTMLVYPHFPSRGSTIYKLANRLRFNVTNRLSRPFELAVYWEYLTFRREFRELEEIAGRMRVVNLHSRDISKVYIDRIFAGIFGYAVNVDPLTYRGRCVRKSDINAKHDGLIVAAPVERIEEGFVYQKLVDNSHGRDEVKDIRVLVVGTALPLVYLKFRKKDVRFKNVSIHPRIAAIGDVLSAEEIEKINLFARSLDLEFGELDVLRDNGDGRIYIVDVNNTPQGPPKHTKKSDAEQVFRLMKDAFVREFMAGETKQT